jgi:hypothetical protein
MARNTPPLHAKGVYTLLAPWTTVGDAIYECIAIRSFADFVEKGQDVYQMFYGPKGLSQAVYEADLVAGAHIVTLQSATSAIIFVPDTYISKFPDLTGVEYKRLVMSVLLGPLPDNVDLTFLKTILGDAASDVTGVVATVTEHVAPYAGVVTADQHATLEAARQAAINNRTIDRATVLQQQTVINAQAQRITDLQAIIMDLQEQLNP